MAATDTNTRIYATDFTLEAQDKAAQIRHLAKIGIAASQSDMNLRNLEASIIALFEVMYRLAEEVEEGCDVPRTAA